MLSGGDLETCMILVNAVAVLKCCLVLVQLEEIPFRLASRVVSYVHTAASETV